MAKNKDKKNSKPSVSYGQQIDKKAVDQTEKKLKKFLKNRGIDIAKKEYVRTYAKAVTYGGYDFKDVAKDVKARRQGKVGNISARKTREEFEKARPGAFKKIKNRPDMKNPQGKRNIRFPKPQTPEASQPEAEQEEAATRLYQGNGGQYGELPKRDKNGKYAWVDVNGNYQEQEGFSLGEGETGWEYLGEHDPSEWDAAQALFKTQPPPTDYDSMSDFQKKEYLDQAHKEISQQFLKAVAEGQTDLIAELGNALQNYKRTMESEDLQLDADIKSTIDTMEASGLTFTGKSREELGDYYSAVGQLTAQDRATILQNMEEINAVRKGAVTNGSAPAAVEMPRPAGIDDPNLTDVQKEQMWRDFYNTDVWKNYTANLDRMTGSSADQTGTAGTGQYGLGDQLNRFANTRALEGNVLRRNRLIQEGTRSTFNQGVRDLGVAAESSLGSANLGGLNYPTIGGRQIFRAANNVLGTTQSSQQASTYNRANKLAGNAAEQYAYTFQI